ncbi:Iron-sulfur cluster-binding domain-containing protein [Rhodovulum sp. ES.010]|uniref:radical SAM/SPASM domain-containing protein n=1 Tax=Rhodovulum sp. ES.010 TaxID=1882821 RepID=UPI000928A4C7|nr:radical SAM/SPASM domain-containing protein [Rhodovulum sp. ES.010]SIO25081.1 Iron-sulfur cluster-binding domain-containing protein [Rhodovulum sp. ES.010]
MTASPDLLDRLNALDRAFDAANRQADEPDAAVRLLERAAENVLGNRVGAEDHEALERACTDRRAGPVALALAARAALAAGARETAVALLRRAQARAANHLTLQRMLAEAEERPERDDAFADRFCAAPFENIETQPGGDVHFCCPAWLPVPIGNLGAQSAGEIWNSPAAQTIRASIHDGSYRFCSRTHCPKLSGDTLPRNEELTKASQRRVAQARATAMEDGPRKIVLSHDRSCNLSCPSCRKDLILARRPEQAAMNKMADEVLFPLMRGADRLRVTASGDPFGSAHFQYVLRHLDRAHAPHLKLDLQTNGVLLTPALWERLKLEGKVGMLLVSADAARAETYAVLRRGGRWDDLRRNLDFFAELRGAGRIDLFRLDFVVQSANFREMPDFVQLARAVGCDGVKFQMIRSWGTYSPEEFATVDISNPAHPDHDAFLGVLRDPVLRPPFAEFWGMQRALADARCNAA